ncbi:MAG: mannitol dehydrogenase family protein [Gemmobacter sp.]
MSDLCTPILQFGTSRFLQAHAALFMSQARAPRSITVVQSSGDPARSRRLMALAAPEGYPVILRGLQGGQPMTEEIRVTSVKRALSTATDWAEITRIFCEEVEVVISNTSDAGWQEQAADLSPIPRQDTSFPAKLFHLLAARHACGGRPLTVMPLELLSQNGRALKARVLEIGRGIGVDPALLDWIAGLPFADSLVDRIVSEPLSPAGAVAEPYALWAIAAAPGIGRPCDHPAVQMVADLEQVERLKLHILNLGHTVLADLWQTAGAPPEALVREAMAGRDGETLRQIYAEEVLPGFASRGMGPEAEAYLATTLDRFANPFLDHLIADIAQNHAQKCDRRIAAFRRWIGPEALPMPRLIAILMRALGEVV